MDTYQDMLDAAKDDWMKPQHEQLQEILDRIDPAYGKSVSCDVGWWPLIKKLNEQIAALAPNYTIAQIKEKYGGLRYYILSFAIEDEDECRRVGAEVNKLIDAAELEVNQICELCGKPGKMKSKNGWLKVICDEHTPEGYHELRNEASSEEALDDTGSADEPASGRRSENPS